jgi:uncharacterized protein YbcI
VIECLRVFDHVGFFLASNFFEGSRSGVTVVTTTGTNIMDKSNSGMEKQAQDRLTDDGNPQAKPNLTMAQQIAQAASKFEQQRTGNTPTSVTVVQADGTLVITLHGALSPAERALAQSPAGAARVQEFHRQLFVNASDSLRQEIKRITGVEVREATAEVEPASGTVVGVFTTGTTVQVYLLAKQIPAESWNGNGQDQLLVKAED